MKLILTISALLLLSGCSHIPSFWDDNEALLAADIRFAVTQIKCERPYQSKVENLKDKVDLLAIYSDSKGSSDVGEIITIMKETTDGFYEDNSQNEFFCNMKKRLLTDQSKHVAQAIMGRY